MHNWDMVQSTFATSSPAVSDENGGADFEGVARAVTNPDSQYGEK
jgi:hypothetical protein